MKYFYTIILIPILTIAVFAQTEILTNKKIISMTQSSLSKGLIICKVKETKGNYDIAARSLIDLKKAGVDDSVIAMMMEKAVKSFEQTENNFSKANRITIL